MSTETGVKHSRPFAIEVFFDGACPLCAREVRFLRRLDRRNRLRFVDIASEVFRPSDYGRPLDVFMSEIQGRLPDGSWVTGVEVFRRIYSAIGLGPLTWWTRLPVISGLLDWAYRLFARNRLRLTGRCSTSVCPAPDARATEQEGEQERVASV
jgi:predicted DCC family thiol-disulfide oxidoreductase YuxK